MPTLGRGALTSPHIVEAEFVPSLGLILRASLYKIHALYHDKFQYENRFQRQHETHIVTHCMNLHFLRELLNLNEHIERTRTF